MPTIEEHGQDCRRDLGDSFEYVHQWLDEFQQEYGPMHRPFRHHTGGVEQVRAMWGDRAAEAARIHIRRDCGGLLLTPEDYRDYWGVDVALIAPEED
jgi:DNA-binding GntR family transcriptional regulator